MAKKIMYPNNKYMDITVGNSGSGKINLATGKLFFKTRWLSYVDWQANLDYVEVDEAVGGVKPFATHCGKGWKLNASKFLVQRKNSSDNKTVYTYIDESGNYQEFTEKYYYLQDRVKQYIKEKDVTVDINGNLTYKAPGLKMFEVYVERKSTSGLVLETDYSRFNNGEFLETRIQEQIEVEEKVKAYFSQLKEYVIVNKIDGGINFSFEHHVLNSEDITSSFKAFLDTLDNLDTLEEENPNNLLLTRLETIQYNSFLYQQMLEIQDVGKSTSFNGEEQKLYDLRYELWNLKSKKAEHAINKYINDYDNLDEEQKSDKKEEYDREIKIAALEKVINAFDANEQSQLVSNQIGKLIEQSAKNIEEIKNLFKQYLSLRQQLNNLYMQIPVNFITDGDNVMGFNKYGQFVATVDSYENQTAIIYEGDKIVAIKDTDNNETSFEYNSDGLLCKISDYNNETTEFEYENSLLTKIKTNEGNIEFSYTDDGKRLAGIANYFGESTVFDYDTLFRVKTITKFKINKSVSNGSIEKQFNPSLGTAIVYKGERTTSVIEPYKNTTTYIFDDNGNPVTVYESLLTSNTLANASAMEYKDEKRSYAVTANLNESNLLPDCYSDTLSATDTVRQKIYHINSVPEGKTDFVFSCWVQANSAQIESTDAERKFELRAEVFYKDGTKDTYRTNFDWKNTDWQFLILPVKIKKPLKQGDTLPATLPVATVGGIILYIDYSNNINQIEVNSPSFRTGKWQYSTFDENGRKLTDEDSESNSITNYYYDDKDRVIKQVLIDGKGNAFETIFEYNKQGKLVRSCDYSGLVRETVYDEKGRELKSIVYNSDDPTSKVYTESRRDEKGNITADIDESGEHDSKTYFYEDSTSVVVKDGKGNKTSFGYKYGNLVSISGTSDGEELTNTVHYTAGLVTKITNGDTDYDYSYTDWGDTVNINIGRNNYATVKHLTDYQATYPFSKSVDYANGCNVLVQFDNFDNVQWQKITCADITEKKSYTYDEMQNVKKITVDINNRRSYNIDYTRENGKVVKEVRDGNYPLIKDYGYTADGELQSTAYTVGTQSLEYGFEKENTPDKRNAKIKLPFEVEQNFAYDGLGRTKKITLGKNLVKDIYYQKYGDHATNRVSTVWYGLKTERAESTRYKYDSAGNIIAVYQNDFVVASYEYDSLNRLIREKNFYLGEMLYDYDHAGNLLCKSINGKKYKYKYFQNGWKDQLLSFNDEKCQYDAIGNPTKYRGRTLAWQGRRLISYSKDGKSATYTYDADGVRTSKTVTDGTTTLTYKYIYDGNTLVAEQRNGEWIYYFYGADGVAGFRYNDITYLYRKNIQGDITHIYTEGGKQVAHYAYDAFGNIKEFQPDNIISQINPFRYRGYYFDTETSLYYLISRYYDPEVGRFISADSIEYLDPETLGGLNLYAYCANNPVMNVDPTGEAFLSFLIGLGIAALIGALTGAASYTASEIISYAITGEWTWSWGMFAGSVVGNTLTAMLSFVAPGLSIVASAMIAGGVSTYLGMVWSNSLGESNYSVFEIAGVTLLSIGFSAFSAGITKNVKIPGFTGRGSISQVARMINTKFYNGLISSISVKTFMKLFIYSASYNIISSLLSGIYDGIEYINYVIKHSFKGN